MRYCRTQSETSRYFVQSLANGLKVLNWFRKDREALTLMEVARLLGWRKASADRWPATLKSLGDLEIDKSPN